MQISICKISSKPNDFFRASEEIKELLRTFKVYIGTIRAGFKVIERMPRRRTAIICIVWEQIMLAAKSIAAIEDPEHVWLVSSRPYGYHAGQKFAQHTGCQCITGRLTLGTFANERTKQPREPRLLIITDPRDANVITEAISTDIPVIVLAESDSPLQYADCVVSGTKKSRDSRLSIAFLYWLLAREVLCLRDSNFKNVSNMSYTDFIEESTVLPAMKIGQRESAEAHTKEENADLKAKIDKLKTKLDAFKAKDQMRKSMVVAANQRYREVSKEVQRGAVSAQRPLVTFADEKHGGSSCA